MKKYLRILPVLLILSGCATRSDDLGSVAPTAAGAAVVGAAVPLAIFGPMLPVAIVGAFVVAAEGAADVTLLHGCFGVMLSNLWPWGPTYTCQPVVEAHADNPN